jgi:hypothetical protein
MDIEYANTILRQSTCGCSTVHTVTAHHRSYPEIAVEAVSAARAVEHLERLLARSLEYDVEPWQREAMQQAVADVQRCARVLAVTPFPSGESRPESQAWPSTRPD